MYIYISLCVCVMCVVCVFNLNIFTNDVYIVNVF